MITSFPFYLKTAVLSLAACLCYDLAAQERYKDDLGLEIEVVTVAYYDSFELDIYLPREADTARRPVILYVHGGGFAGGRRYEERYAQFCRKMARKGYVTASMSYPLLMKGQSFSCDQPSQRKVYTFLTVGQYIARGTAFLMRRHEQYQIDPKKIVLGGSSAGAEAVLHAAYWPKCREDILPPDFQYAGVISLAGALLSTEWIDIQTAIPTQLFHGVCDPLVPYGTASHHYCKPEDLGYMILHGAYSIATHLHQIGRGYFLVTDCGGGHEWNDQPLFDFQEEITDFLYHDVLAGKTRQLHYFFRQGNRSCPEYGEFSFCKE